MLFGQEIFKKVSKKPLCFFKKYNLFFVKIAVSMSSTKKKYLKNIRKYSILGQEISEKFLKNIYGQKVLQKILKTLPKISIFFIREVRGKQ